ncbi:hypothetical protein RNAN_0550 [Rheinheimera nanhaiensis E407-8]|uniref:Uncharacterized protein n=1 Tax=Rheinheimera nanhaiensis E407-8 TaxID=562729 RepID=I1DU53_9GAMM|nr:hypothetical protein RNAN_0550 [Rheinheimera nanhaiensis E407-8]
MFGVAHNKAQQYAPGGALGAHAASVNVRYSLIATIRNNFGCKKPCRRFNNTAR